MKRLFHLGIFLFTVLSSTLYAQNGKMKAFIDYKSYYSPEIGPYVDIQFQFIAYTIKFEGVQGGLQSKLTVSTILTNNNTGDTVSVNRYVLESPLMRDSIVEDFYDIVRIPLQPGQYTAHIQLNDLLSKEKELDGKIDITVSEKVNEIALSDVLVAEVALPSTSETPFQKSGYEIIPRLSNFFGQGSSNLPYYVELYNTHLIKDSSFGLRQQVISTLNNSPVQGFSRFIRFAQNEVVPMLRNVDLTKLYSGSYVLRLELIDKTGNAISKPAEFFFERVNENEQELSVENIILDPHFQKSITEDSLKYYLESLIPIARPAEAKSIVKTLKANSPELCRKHLQQFWVFTAGAAAYEEWLRYKQTVILVEKNYGNNFQEGFETDRGRVYLQYGQPNTITVREMNSSEYPYEIWHYYKIKNFSNKRFVFYNPDLTNNAYRLLHSDMVGELQNYKWQQMLTRRNSGAMDVDSKEGESHYGGNSQYYYKQD